MPKLKSPNSGLPQGDPALSTSLIDAGRRMIEKAYGDGAMAVLVIYENAEGDCKMLYTPFLESVRRGLLQWATDPTTPVSE